MQHYSKQEYKCPDEISSMARGCIPVNMPYVKKWVRTRHAVLFRLSNRTVQVRIMLTPAAWQHMVVVAVEVSG